MGVRRDGEAVRRAREHAGRGPKWSSDGSKLLYDDGGVIVAIDVNTREKIRLGPLPGIEVFAQPRFLVQDDMLYYLAQPADGDIWVLEPEAVGGT